MFGLGVKCQVVIVITTCFQILQPTATTTLLVLSLRIFLCPAFFWIGWGVGVLSRPPPRLPSQIYDPSMNRLGIGVLWQSARPLSVSDSDSRFQTLDITCCWLVLSLPPFLAIFPHLSFLLFVNNCDIFKRRVCWWVIVFCVPTPPFFHLCVYRLIVWLLISWIYDYRFSLDWVNYVCGSPFLSFFWRPCDFLLLLIDIRSLCFSFLPYWFCHLLQCGASLSEWEYWFIDLLFLRIYGQAKDELAAGS